MRVARLVGGFGVLLVVATTTSAQTVSDTAPLYQAKVVIDESLVRAGPSNTFYPTNKLSKGQLVEVVGEERDGWLKVLPPLDGSFSYVQLKAVEQFTQKVWIVKERTRPLIGSSIVGTKPNVEGPALAPGTQLESMGLSVPDQGETWLRIVPPRREVRYIFASDVQRVDDGESHTPAKPSIPIIPVSQQRTLPSVGDPNARFNTANLQTTGSRQDYPTTVIAPVSTSMGQPNYCTTQGTTQLCVPTSISQQTAPTNSNAVAQWSGVSKLLSSGYNIDGKHAYRLVDKYDRLLMYVTAGPNIDLNAYVFRSVDLHGQVTYRGDYRANCMVVDTIVPAP
jgi:hypothetical protein